MLCLFPRSGLGFKFRLQLNNTVGIIDSDYSESDNEGHIFVKITNDTNTGKTISLKRGDGFVRGFLFPTGSQRTTTQPKRETAVWGARISVNNTENSYLHGLKDGIPIGLGYLSVSFTFGIMAVSGGLPVWGALLISMTNLTSAGQFAGLPLMLGGASYLEAALTQLIINLRYSLMSLSLSQKLDRRTGVLSRLGISFGVTDEIFAVSVTNPRTLGQRYMFGLETIPYIGWALGTLLGAGAGIAAPRFNQKRPRHCHIRHVYSNRGAARKGEQSRITGAARLCGFELLL